MTASTPAPDLLETYHSLMECSQVPTAALEGASHVVRYANPAFCQLAGKPCEALTGRPFADTIQEGDACIEVLDRVYRTGDAETHTEPEGFEPHPPYWSYTVWPVLGAAQRPAGVMMQVTETTRLHQQARAVNQALLMSLLRQDELTVAAEDLNERLRAEITERERYAEHQKLLLDELNHRVKNTLATVQSLAMQSFRRNSDTGAARNQFEDRLLALAKAHDVLTQESWGGAPLDKVVGEAVAPYRDQQADRFEIQGVSAWVPPNYALALALALHELCTNAVKYGALSNGSGRISIAWGVTGTSAARELRMRWTETGGPRVTPPKRRGFGSRLVERGLKQDLGGEVRLEFAETGVVCQIAAPLRN